MRASRLTACLCLILFVSSSRPGTAAAQDSLKRAAELGVEVRKLARGGQYPLAISKAREALAMSEQALQPNDIRLANPLFNLAQILRDTGHYTEARPLYERAIKIIELDRGSEHPDFASTLFPYANLLFNIGDYRAARSAAERGLNSLEKTLHRNDPRLGAALSTLGRIYLATGNFTAAKPLFERALQIHQTQRRPNPQPIAFTLGRLGTVHQGLKDYAGAKKYYEQALRMREQSFGADHPGVGYSLLDLARLSQAAGDSGAAKPLYERALTIARKTAAPELQRTAAARLAEIYESENRLLEARALYQEAIGVLETLMGQFEEESARGQYLRAGNKLAAYDALARLLMKLHEQDDTKGYDREAWAVIAAKRARLIAEVMTASRPKLQNPKARQEVEKVTEIQGQAVALEKALAQEQAKALAEQESERVKRLTTLLAQTKSDYLKQVQTFLTQYPQYRTQFVDQQTVDPKALAKFADRLPAGTLAIQLFPSPDALYIFAVAPGGYFKVKSQALAQSELYKMIKEYRQYLERAATQRLPWNDDGSDLYRQNLQPFKEITQKLSAHMFGPIESELREYKNLVIIPNDMLLYLPIHALTRNLPDGSTRFLSETHVVGSLTQLELADLVNPVAPDAKAALLALSNPDGSLPAASREVREIGKVRSSVTTLDGAQATKEHFLSLAGKFPDLHLATHGVLDPERPENSYLLMAGVDKASQQLTIGEIAGLRLVPNGLAILSACETAVGEQVPGAALITLSAAFSQAGSQSIMASLWKVEDSATRDLMIAFHGGLAKVGRAIALQQAQISVLKNPGTAHPYYWAPFILIGGR